jgi:flavorubredoxin
MNEPTMLKSRKVAPDTTSLVSYIPIPGYGLLPVNAFVIHATEPMLVDTGMSAVRTDFLRELKSVIEPKELRWIWITHTDMDHLGNLAAILAEAPNARVITTYVGMAKIGLQGIALDRVYLLNPGQSLDIGDRKILAVTPPTFDAPETTGLFDQKTSTLFSADSFGALMAEPVENAAGINDQDLCEGGALWSSIDAPWLGLIDTEKFGKTLTTIDKLKPEVILSSHLPVATGMNRVLLDNLAEAYKSPRFVGPDQQALEQMMVA